MNVPQQLPILHYQRLGAIPPERKTISKWVHWLVMTPVWGVATFFLIGIGEALFGITGAVIVIGGLIMLAHSLNCIRRARAAAILVNLEQLVRLNLPLTTLLEVAANGERGKLRLRLQRLSQSLCQGNGIAESLAAWVPEMSAHTIAIVAVGEHTGQLQPVLARLIRADCNKVRSTSVSSSGSSSNLYQWYPMAVILILSLVLVRVLPKFKYLFQDFRIQVPWWSRIFFGMSMEWGWLIGIVALLAVLSLCARWWRTILTQDRLRFKPFASLTDWLVLNLPITRGLILSRGLSDVFHTLANQAANHEPLLIELASSIPQNRSVRILIQRWADAVRAGTTLDEAARQVGLPPLVAATLRPAITTDRTANAFDFLARYYGARFNRGLILLRGAYVPAAVLLMGFMVGLIAFCIVNTVVILTNGVMPKEVAF